MNRQSFAVAAITTMVLSEHPDRVEPARGLLEEYLWLPDVWERFGGVPARFPESFELEIRTFPGVAIPPAGDVIVGVASAGDVVAVGQVVGLEGDVCEFKRVYVRPDHRRRGVAVQVATAMTDRARELGYRRVVLDVMPERTAAIALWAGLGFRSCPPYRTYPCPMEFMAMDLVGGDRLWRGAVLPVQAVVFDMDGTLFDSTACVTTAYRKAVLAAGGPDYSRAEIVAAYPLGPPAVILAHLLGRQATPQDEGVYLASLEKHVDLIEVHDGVPDLLAGLEALDVPLAVFTGASGAAARQLLAGAELLRFFPVVVGGDDVAGTKPEPHGILRACDLLGVAASVTAYVGDSPLDLQAARRSGAVAVAAAWGHLFDAGAPCDVLATTPQDVLAIVGRHA